MDIDLVFKIAAVGIVVAVLNQLLVRSDRRDQLAVRSHQEPVRILGWSCSSSLRR